MATGEADDESGFVRSVPLVERDDDVAFSLRGRSSVDVIDVAPAWVVDAAGRWSSELGGSVEKSSSLHQFRKASFDAVKQRVRGNGDDFLSGSLRYDHDAGRVECFLVVPGVDGGGGGGRGAWHGRHHSNSMHGEVPRGLGQNERAAEPVDLHDGAALKHARLLRVGDCERKELVDRFGVLGVGGVVGVERAATSLLNPSPS